MNKQKIAELRAGLETGFINGGYNSSLAYQPQFLSNNHKEGKKVLSSIEDELLACDKFQISVAFITMGGITPLLQTLKELEKNGIPGEILTTNYLNFSEPKALEKLHGLSNITLKMYDVEKAAEGFHTKGYIFKKEEIYRIIIGSSNMTSAALTSNREWNTKVVSTEQGEVAKQIVEEYNELWNSRYALSFDNFYEEYKERYYRATDGSRKLLIDEEVSDNVVRIFNMFLDGKGYAGIAKTLQNEGILSPPKYRFYKAGKSELAEKAREWHPTHVKEILQGEYYIGNIVHGKQRKALDTGRKNVKTDASTWQRIENAHEPIIDKDTFYKTRERMEHIKKKHLEASKPKADVPKKPDNILVYKTKCACCGGSVLIGRHHTYSDKFYYKCKNRRKLARLCDNKYSYDYSEVMDSVFSVIRQHMSLCVEKTKFVQKMNSRKENVLQYDIYTKQIAKLQNDVRRITANKSGLYEDYREQLITAEELCQYQKEYECRVNEIEAQITELLHRRSLYEKEFHIDEGWEETVNKYMTKRKLTKELVDAFVSEIVFNDGNIEVKLLYDDFLKELLEVAEEREVSSNG